MTKDLEAIDFPINKHTNDVMLRSFLDLPHAALLISIFINSKTKYFFKVTLPGLTKNYSQSEI